MVCIFGFYHKYGTTIWEDMFDISTEWRSMFIVGLPVSFALFLFMGKIIKYKNGQLIITINHIMLSASNKYLVVPYHEVLSMVLIKDVPFRDDDRTDSQKATTMVINTTKGKKEIEIELNDRQTLERLNHAIEVIKPIVRKLRVEYKGSSWWYGFFES